MPEATLCIDLLAVVRKNLEESLRRKEIRRLESAMADALARVDGALFARQPAKEREHIACRAGCGTCCVVNVGVLYPEALRIVRHLQQTLTPEALHQLRQRLGEMYHQTLGLDDEERLFLRKPCLFLDAAQNCSIYTVRPILCRSVTSANAEDCRDALASVALGEESPVLMNLLQKESWEQLFTLWGEVIEAAGLEGRSQRLVTALYQLLPQAEPEEIFWSGARWRSL